MPDEWRPRTTDDDSPPSASPVPAPPPSETLSRRRVLLGLTAVGGIGAATVGGFGYARGVLTPETLTSARFADDFEQVFGRHEGFRRNHAKGLSATGRFVSNGAGEAVSQAAVFRPGEVPVTARFSLSGGLPCAPDGDATVRGLGLLFMLPNGEQWRTAMVNIAVFLDSTPQNFHDRMIASKAAADTGKPDPETVKAYLDKHPETVAAMEIVHQRPPASGFENSTFHGLNAFGFTTADGATTPVRWMLVPEQASEPSTTPQPTGEDYLFSSLIQAAEGPPLRWRLMLVLGAPEDPTHDATKPWPADRPTVDVGTVSIDAVQTEAEGNARDINFDPLVLPHGIEALDDPLLAARSSVYARSFARRSGETKQSSAVDVEAVRDAR